MSLDPKPYKSARKLLEAIDNGEFIIPYFKRWLSKRMHQVAGMMVNQDRAKRGLQKKMIWGSLSNQEGIEILS